MHIGIKEKKKSSLTSEAKAASQKEVLQLGSGMFPNTLCHRLGVQLDTCEKV
jgi:hypothetical protein